MRREFSSVKSALEKMNVKYSDKKLAQALYEVRREQIVVVVQKQVDKSNSIPEIDPDLSTI